MRTHVFLLPLLLGATSCTASLDLDRFHKQEAQVTDALNVTFYDLHFGARNMQSHLGEQLEVRLVDKSNAVQAKIVYVDVPKPDFSFDCPKLIPKTSAPYRIDFWADHNKSGRYDGIEGGINDKDHAWRRVLADPLPEDVRLVQGRYELSFLHDTAFVDIFTDLQGNKISGADTLLPFSLGIVDAGAWVGKPIEIHVVDKAAGRLVGVHRQGRAMIGYIAQITGILDEETPYEVSVWVDENGDDQLSVGEPSWRLDVLSDGNGVKVDLDLGKTPQTPLTEAK